jgi:hypothetical protein
LVLQSSNSALHLFVEEVSPVIHHRLKYGQGTSDCGRLVDSNHHGRLAAGANQMKYPQSTPLTVYFCRFAPNRLRAISTAKSFCARTMRLGAQVGLAAKVNASVAALQPPANKRLQPLDDCRGN